ncbi:hypothetical protein VQ042_12655 [Aurantimonas sp. A2-1-M11]|uniref:hypothetical protein n=1 Tax=Aurantimonas sp. A2-1-M11 TaxID=3113712 RepID=UPI002F95BA55
MKTTLLAATMLGFAAGGAFAQEAQTAPQTTPTCAEALTQIESLLGQADQAGLEIETAEGHVETARAAQGSEDEEACIRALVMAQNDVLAQAQQAGAVPQTQQQ